MLFVGYNFGNWTFKHIMPPTDLLPLVNWKLMVLSKAQPHFQSICECARDAFYYLSCRSL